MLTKKKLDFEFEMKDLGMMHYFLGMEVWRNGDGISMGQGKYTVEIVKRFGMMDCKAMTTPMALNLNLFSDGSSEVVDIRGNLRSKMGLLRKIIK